MVRRTDCKFVTTMGAKVKGESYKPGHYAVGNLQTGANGWRSSYEEEKTSTGELFNGFMTTEGVCYSDYDKEMFKHTMLAHEAAFRQQVYELHRVYRIQRDLVKRYQNKEMLACPRLEDASQRNSPSQVSLHGSKTIAANEKRHYMKFLREGSVQSSPNGFPSSNAALHTKHGMFDLERGADNYFEDDNASDNKPIDFLGVSSDTKHQSDAGITIARAEGLGRFGHNSSTSFLPTTDNLGGHHVADLNEPVLGMYMGRTNGSVSGDPSYSLENSWQQSVWRSSTTNYSFNKEYSKDKRFNEGTSSNFFDTSSRIKQEEKPLIDKGKPSNISFLAPRYSETDPDKTFNAADGRSGNSNQFIYQCSNNSTGWYLRSPLEASAINHFSRHAHLHHSSLNTVAPIPSPHIGYPSVASRVGSCIVDPRSYNNNADVQSFPSINGSPTVDSYTCLGAPNQAIGTLTHNLKKIDNSDSSYSGVPLDSLSASRPRHLVAISGGLEQNNGMMFEHTAARHCHKDPDFANGNGRNNFNLNEALSDGQEDVLVEQDGVCAGSLQRIEGEGSVSEISWLSKKASFGDFTGLEEPRKVFEHSYGTVMEMNVNKDRSGAALALCNLPDSASTSVGCGAKKDKTQESAAFLPPLCQKLVPRDGQAAEGVIVQKRGAAILNFFDLNDDVPNEDNSESSIVSHECHVSSLRNNHAKRAFVIDLEVPACEDAADTAAAEDILALSMDVPTTDKPDSMLQWFAELAVSGIDDHARQVEVQGCIGNSSDDDDLDSFESLTLKLEGHWNPQ